MRDEHRLRRTEVRERRHQRVARRRGLRRQRVDDAGDRALEQRNAPPQVEPQIERHLLVARPAGVQTPAGVAEPLDEQPLDEAVHVLVGAGDERRIATGPARGSRPAPASICRASSGVSTPAVASARAHARLPVTSSSNRRRSKRNDEPNSNAAASGAVSKRPDHRVVISLQSPVVESVGQVRRSSPASTRAAAAPQSAVVRSGLTTRMIAGAVDGWHSTTVQSPLNSFRRTTPVTRSWTLST